MTFLLYIYSGILKKMEELAIYFTFCLNNSCPIVRV